MLELLAMRECLFFMVYITGKSQFPKPLCRKVEDAAVRRMAKGDDEARKELITHNLRLVSHIARKYQVPGYGADDLISIGVIGLIKAVNSFKPTSGTALGTYAARCIENEILMTLRSSRKRQGDVSLQDPIGTDGEGNDMVLEMRYGLTDGVQHPQHEIADILGISRSYVSRVEKHAIQLLRDELERP